MDYLTNDNYKRFNLFGLKEICRYNRDIINNFNQLMKDDLIIYIKSLMNDNIIIKIPPYIIKNSKCYAKYNLAKVI